MLSGPSHERIDSPGGESLSMPDSRGLLQKASPATTYILLAAIVFLGAFLRLYRIDYQSTWRDEDISITIGHAPLNQMIDYFKSHGSEPPLDTHPPVYHYLL